MHNRLRTLLPIVNNKVDIAFKRRAIVVGLVLVAGLTALSVKLVRLQVFERTLSETSNFRNFRPSETLPARRGELVDRNDVVLASNRPEGALIADRFHLKEVKILKNAVAYRYASQMDGWTSLDDKEKVKLISRTKDQLTKELTKDQIIEEHLDYATEIIGRELRVPSAELVEKINNGKARVVVKKRIPEDRIRSLEVKLQAAKIQGFSFDRSHRRHYFMPTFAPHILGFVNYKGEGKHGLEQSMNEILAGVDGERELKRSNNGSVNLIEAAEYDKPKMGKHVKITLDMGIQAIAEEELDLAINAYNAEKGSIIVVDPYTGDVLAMASRPHFNLNLKENFSKSSTSFAVAAQYEAGSVLKIVGMAAALEEGVANRNTVVNCGWGKIYRYGFYINDHFKYGDLNFDSVMAKSSNTGVFQFADFVGPVGFYKYLDAFGFGQRTNFPIPGEARGNIQDRTNMRNYASATYGYGVSVSPLQLAMAYSVLANGGTLLQPRLIDSIISDEGHILDRTPVMKVRRVISERTAKSMCLALEQVVLRGTGRKAKVAGHRAGGKTGTARKWNNEIKDYDPDKKYLTFCGIVPVQKPRFVCVVTIDEPSGLGEDFKIGGGTIAAPVFSQVSERIANFMNIPPTEVIIKPDSPVAHSSN